MMMTIWTCSHHWQ